MRYYLIAGEASGDMHAANLMAAIKQLDAEATFRAWGGDRMKAQGAVLVKHYRDLAFMGFTEVVANIGTIFKNIAYCKADIAQFKPDAIIFIDYPGFNLRIAQWAHKQGFRTIYYISPQIWAWNAKRVHKIKRDIDLMLVILPFEKAFYDKYRYPVNYVGHPLLDEIKQRPFNNQFLRTNNIREKPLIALLPGSRRQEIKTVLPIMLSVVNDFPDFQFVVAAAPSMPIAFYENIIANNNVKIVQAQTYDLLQFAKAALVTSGTATLETALFNVPQIVCYKGGKISYLIAKQLVGKRIKYISLVNLIADEPLVEELIQDELNHQRLTTQLSKILSEDGKKEILEGYVRLQKQLGNTGASDRAAKLIIDFLNPDN